MMAGSLFHTLVLGTLIGEIPSTAALVLEELGVCGAAELDKLLADVHMIAIGKADVYSNTDGVVVS